MFHFTKHMFRHSYVIFSCKCSSVAHLNFHCIHDFVIELRRFSKAAQIKLRQLLKRYYKTDLDIKSVFSTFKVRNMFSVKDSVPQSLRSRVVYKFTCAGCNAVEHLQLKMT